MESGEPPPQRGGPQRCEPQRCGPQQGEPQRGGPQRGGPRQGEPRRGVGGGEKGYHFGGEVVPFQGSRSESAFPSSQGCCAERPAPVKGAPLLGAAKRILDGEDRSEMI